MSYRCFLAAEKFEAASKELNRMLEIGVVEPSNSKYGSPLHLVRKKDDDWRFCIDYRKLNEKTIRDEYPLPRMDDLMHIVAGRKWFSTIDLKSGYWQLDVAPGSIAKTAFSFPGRGLFHFKRMPFGLKNAGATFQRAMDEIVRPFSDFAVVYIDDIVVTADSGTQICDRLD